MRSRIYTSRFYPQDIQHISSDAPHAFFDDLERANADRVERDRIKNEQKREKSHLTIIEDESTTNALAKKLKRVILIRLKSNNSSCNIEENSSCNIEEDINNNLKEIKASYSMRKKIHKTKFRIFYENGIHRDIDVTNGSYLYRLLIRNCKLRKK